MKRNIVIGIIDIILAAFCIIIVAVKGSACSTWSVFINGVTMSILMIAGIIQFYDYFLTKKGK
jgi:hypothetical protein